jgi:rSAM/selenodomain-associated transferase 2/rSAM/selenodomain-associated transferase 1
VTSLSVVIPTLDEARRLPLLLDDLEALSDLVVETLVVDGGSTDGTDEIARDHGARVIAAPRGRGVQLLAGGTAARGDWIFFVHADCRLPPEAAEALRAFVSTASECEFAHFAFELEGRGGFRRFIELGQRIREGLTGLAYGDQGLVVSRALYRQAGGHPEWSVMEDVGVMGRLGRSGRRRLPARLPTSARRYEREGRLRGWLRNAALITGFRLGVPPGHLARWYPPEPGPARSGRASLVVFAKAPVPGRVKTRLAKDVGSAEAVRIYRTIGRETVDALRHGPWNTRVYVDPPTSEGVDHVRKWLGSRGLSYRRQSEGDLGRRMAAAIHECLDDSPAVVVVGTDTPGLDASCIRSALEALEATDVVIGPAEDGGYYLIGMKRPNPSLFRGIPWSTSGVLPQTRAAIRRAGLRLHLLETRRDVDTLPDVPEAYLSR